MGNVEECEGGRMGSLVSNIGKGFVKIRKIFWRINGSLCISREFNIFSKGHVTFVWNMLCNAAVTVIRTGSRPVSISLDFIRWMRTITLYIADDNDGTNKTNYSGDKCPCQEILSHFSSSRYNPIIRMRNKTVKCESFCELRYGAFYHISWIISETDRLILGFQNFHSSWGLVCHLFYWLCKIYSRIGHGTALRDPDINIHHHSIYHELFIYIKIALFSITALTTLTRIWHGKLIFFL